MKEQDVNVRLRDFGRVTRVDRSVLAPLNPHLFRGGVGENDVLLLDADRLEVGPKPRRRHVDVEDARDADMDRLALLPAFLARANEGALDVDAANAEKA